MFWRIILVLCFITLLAAVAFEATQPGGAVAGTTQHDEFDWSDR